MKQTENDNTTQPISRNTEEDIQNTLSETFKKVGVLITGHVAKELQPQHGTYINMFRKLFGTILPHAQIKEFDVTTGEWPGESPEGAQQMDLYIISGSRHSVYEDIPWIHKLREAVQDMVHQRIPVLGICFGHQILAQVMGGTVEKFKPGWQIGLVDYNLVEASPLRAANNSLPMAIPTIHQDQVIAPPTGGNIWAKTDQCFLAGIEYSNLPLISMQAHPEFSLEYLRDLLKERKDLFPEEVYLKALKKIDNAPVNSRGNFENSVKVGRQILFLLASKI